MALYCLSDPNSGPNHFAKHFFFTCTEPSRALDQKMMVKNVLVCKFQEPRKGSKTSHDKQRLLYQFSIFQSSENVMAKKYLCWGCRTSLDGVSENLLDWTNISRPIVCYIPTTLVPHVLMITHFKLFILISTVWLISLFDIRLSNGTSLDSSS